VQYKRQGFLQRQVVKSVYHTVSIDILGPLVTSSKGRKYIPVMIDYFTRWVVAVALANTRAATLADASCCERWVVDYMPPLRLLSDRGTQFTSSLLRQLCKRVGIKSVYTTAYHPQTNAHAERFNRYLAAILSLYVNPSQRDWDLHLLTALMAYRSSTHDVAKLISLLSPL
jgi:transposase InsO family protein